MGPEVAKTFATVFCNRKGVSEEAAATHAENRMKKALIIFTAAVLAAGTMAGCVPKEDKTNISLDPDFSVPSTIELDFTERCRKRMDDKQQIPRPSYAHLKNSEFKT